MRNVNATEIFDGVDYALSFHDLNLVDGFKEAQASGNKKVLDIILYTNGMDVEHGYELVACRHRTINKIEYNGIRVEGYERTDKAWIATGCASKEAILKSIPDLHLRTELRKMGRERTQETYFDDK